jgi:hypothetical protein
MSPEAVELFQDGLALGNNPQAFSKVGDGEVATSWFLTMHDLDPSQYDLGPHEYLEPVIEYYAGSFEHVGVAAHAGFSTTLILDPLLATNDICEVEESPLECELRRHSPSFAFISLGTNQVWTPDVFAAELRQMVEICIERGVVPILATKGDNLEGDHRMDSTPLAKHSERSVEHTPWIKHQALSSNQRCKSGVFGNMFFLDFFSASRRKP